MMVVKTLLNYITSRHSKYTSKRMQIFADIQNDFYVYSKVMAAKASLAQ